VHLPPQGHRGKLGWEGGIFTYQEAKSCLKHHGGNLAALDDPITMLGEHYTFAHFDEPAIDPATYTLSVGGNVTVPLKLTLAQLMAMTNVQETVLLECAGNGRAACFPRPRFVATPWFQEAFGVYTYTGVRLVEVLALAGIKRGTREIVFTGADEGVEGLVHHHFQRSLPLADARNPDVILAWAANGQPLPRGHGFPLRLVVPHWYGMASVKWLTSIHAITHEFRGFQQYRSYRYTDADTYDNPGRPVTHNNVRAAMKPPGIPDTDSGSRWLGAGPVTLVGKAWSGHGQIARVEVSTNGGHSWRTAKLASPISPQSWTPWSIGWNARKGNHVLAVRATDTAGHTQPMKPVWNFLGVGVNAIELTRVLVT
jgi:DMSO/TMAO reductase YedYZ molybdopterin-dependent catalytic subunit